MDGEGYGRETQTDHDTLKTVSQESPVERMQCLLISSCFVPLWYRLHCSSLECGASRSGIFFNRYLYIYIDKLVLPWSSRRCSTRMWSWILGRLGEACLLSHNNVVSRLSSRQVSCVSRVWDGLIYRLAGALGEFCSV